MDNINDERPSRQNSKISLGSSSSILSTDEQLDGEGPLTPTDKIQDDEDDDLSVLNNMLQADSPGSLSNEEVTDEDTTTLLEQEDDDLQTEQDSASPLSSIPDDFPLSRSASPEPSQVEKITKTSVTKTVEKTVETKFSETKKNVQTKTVLRKRRKEVAEKKQKQEKQKTQEKSSTHSEDTSDQEPEVIAKKPRLETPEAPENEPKSRRRRASKPETETRRKSRQEEQIIIKKEQEPSEQQEEKDVDMNEASIQCENENDLKKTNGSTEQQMEEQKVTDLKDRDYIQKHKEALDALTHIEIEFARLRDKMYQEKMSELNDEAQMIANGTHPELVTLMAEIEEKKVKRISNAEAWRKYQHANFKQQFEGFEYQANIHFISQKTALRRSILSNLQSNKWSMEDERTKLNESTQNPIYPNSREILAYKQELKEETHELQDIKDEVGFPMAPDPSGLNAEDIDEDLKKLGINL